MAIQRVQTATLAESATTSVTATLTSVTAGNTILAWGWGAGSTNAAMSATGCTDNQTHTLTRVLAGLNWNGSSSQIFSIYLLTLPASYATYTVTLTDANASFGISVVIAEYSGLAVSPFDQQASTGSGGTSVTSLGAGTTPTNTADTTLAASLVTNGNSLTAYGYTQAGGANWPTGTGGASTTGGRVAVEQNGSFFNPGSAWDSITTAWQSATATDSFTFASSQGGAGLATFKAPFTGQTALPAADVSVGTWTTNTGGTTNLYQAIDETVADDTDYIQSVTNPSAAAETTGLATLTDPVSSTGHIVWYRVART